jgi:hypothetical protein
MDQAKQSCPLSKIDQAMSATFRPKRARAARIRESVEGISDTKAQMGSFAQYEHAHRFRLIGKFFWLKGRRRRTGYVLDPLDIEEGCENRSL